MNKSISFNIKGKKFSFSLQMQKNKKQKTQPHTHAHAHHLLSRPHKHHKRLERIFSKKKVELFVTTKI